MNSSQPFQLPNTSLLLLWRTVYGRKVTWYLTTLFWSGCLVFPLSPAVLLAMMHLVSRASLGKTTEEQIISPLKKYALLLPCFVLLLKIQGDVTKRCYLTLSPMPCDETEHLS